jgi:Domain of unknown function (DUF5666)
MRATGKRLLMVVLSMGSAGFLLTASVCATPFEQAQQTAGTARRIGAVKAINGTAITLTPDSGADVIITIQATTQIVRIAPGEKDLKNAAPIQLQDIQVGDRILAGGKISEDDHSFVASSVVAMKRADLEAQREQVLQDWQKRGVDGLAKAVDAAAGTITISVRSKDVVIHAAGGTVIRRYAADSLKFDDAKTGSLQEIHAGDQVRARGNRSADGGELAAEEIVSGSFPFFAGTINSIDASSSTLNVRDLSSKKTVLVKVTQDSQLRRLPPEMAQRIAVRLKGAAAGAIASAESGAAPSPASEGGSVASSGGGAEGGMPARRTGMGGRSDGAPDLQQILNRAPTVSLADLHKGDAVVILSTDDKAASGTVIKLFSGVEPILQAAPNAAQAMMLAPWSLGGPSGDLGGP